MDVMTTEPKTVAQVVDGPEGPTYIYTDGTSETFPVLTDEEIDAAAAAEEAAEAAAAKS